MKRHETHVFLYFLLVPLNFFFRLFSEISLDKKKEKKKKTKWKMLENAVTMLKWAD